MIRVEKLSKKLGNKLVLNELSLHVPKGGVYGLVGPNGAGKSTLIRHVIGVYRPDSGAVLINGKNVYENPEVKTRIASVTDDFFFFRSADCEEMMRYYSTLYPQFSVERYRKLKDAFPEIDDATPIHRYSKGMQKQAAFRLALSCMPDALILDEPVDGLDPVIRRQVWSLMMQDIRGRGMTVLVSSHNLRELEDVCDHVGIINHGNLLLERSLNSLQGSVCKLHVVFNGGLPELPKDLNVMNISNVGSIYTFIIRGNEASARNLIATLGPIFMEALPLTLEEIFIYELGGEGYAVSDLVL